MLSFLFGSFIALLLGLSILLFLDVSTLFLAALLLAIVSVKMQKSSEFLTLTFALWFALSVAPATSLTLQELATFSNGFLLQGFLSWLLFLYFYKQKPSIIQRIHESKMKAGIVMSAIIAGFAAGISSAALWQIYTQIFN